MKENSPQILTDIAKETIISSLKIQFSLLGPLGTIMDETIFNFSARLKERRLGRFFNDLINELNVRVKSLEVSQFNLDSLRENETFHDILLETLKSVANTNSDEKRKLLANFLLNKVVLTDTIDHDYNFLLLRYIDELTITHIMILNHLQINIEEYKKLRSFDILFQNFSNEQKNINLEKKFFRALVRDLENKTLCVFSKNVLEYGSTGGYVEAEDSRIVPGVYITNIGTELLNFLKTG